MGEWKADVSPRGPLIARRCPDSTGRMQCAICLSTSCALPCPLPEAGSFTNAHSDCSQGGAERSSHWAEPLSAVCWGVVSTSAQLAGLGFPRQELGSGPGLPQGLARGQRPSCWLHTGSLVPAGPIARLAYGSVYRKSWTSAQRYHLFWASSSATPTSHRVPRSMRRLRVERAPTGGQPR